MPIAGDDDAIADPGHGRAAGTGDGSLDEAELVAGRYRIVRWLGAGSMGRVYEAYDTELGERIALKVLRGGLTEQAIERFRREVKLTRRIGRAACRSSRSSSSPRSRSRSACTSSRSGRFARRSSAA